MKNVFLTILDNKRLSKDVYEMKLFGDLSEIKNPGEFVEIKIDGHYLRRPFGVCDYDNKNLTILYKVVGSGTNDMTTLKKGDIVDTLVGLGNGFDIKKSKQPLLVGGGIGIAPLYSLVKNFAKNNIRPTVILGYRCEEELFYVEEFEKIADVIITTDDGSCGCKGNCVDYLKINKIGFDYYYACGPIIMLKNLALLKFDGEISMEARMGCGFGACMGCSIETKNGAKRVCKEGPVFKASEVIF